MTTPWLRSLLQPQIDALNAWAAAYGDVFARLARHRAPHAMRVHRMGRR